MSNILLPDDATFENDLGFWRIFHILGTIERVAAPTPHSGSGVMKLTQGPLADGSPAFSPGLVTGGVVSDEVPFAYAIEGGSTVTASIWAQSDPSNPQDAAGYGGVLELDAYDSGGAIVARGFSNGGFPTLITNSGWTEITVSITAPPGGPYEFGMNLSWEISTPGVGTGWSGFFIVPFVIYLSDASFDGVRRAIEAPLPSAGAGTITTLHQYDDAQTEFSRGFANPPGLADMGSHIACKPEKVAGVLTGVSDIWLIDKATFDLSLLTDSAFAVAMATGPDGNLYVHDVGNIIQIQPDGTVKNPWFTFPSGYGGFLANARQGLLSWGRDGALYAICTGPGPPYQSVFRITAAIALPELIPSPWAGFDNALEFPSNAGVNCGAWDAGGVPAISGVGAAASFTLEARVQELSGDLSAICGWFKADQPPQLFGSSPLAIFWTDDTGNDISISDPGPSYILSDGLPHVVAADYDGTTMRLYIDGNEIASQATTGIFPYDPGDNFWIGNDDEGESSNGIIDEVRWSNVARYAGSYIPDPGPFVADAHTLALYHLDVVSGNTTPDDSGNGHTGSLVGEEVATGTRIAELDEPLDIPKPHYAGLAITSDGTVWVQLWKQDPDSPDCGSANVLRRYRPSVPDVVDIPIMPRVDVWVERWGDGFAYDDYNFPGPSTFDNSTEILMGIYVDNQDRVIVPMQTFKSTQGTSGFHDPHGFPVGAAVADNSWFLAIADDGTAKLIGGVWDESLRSAPPANHVVDGPSSSSMACEIQYAVGISKDHSILYFIDSSDELGGHTANVLRRLDLPLVSRWHINIIGMN